MKIAAEVVNLEKKLGIPSVSAERSGFRLVDDAEYMEAFQCFNLVIVAADGTEHDIFGTQKARETQFDNEVSDTDPLLDRDNAERLAKLDEMQAYYTNACIAAERLETPRMAKIRKAAKAAGVKLSQDDLETYTAPASWEIPGFYDEDETDEIDA